MITLRVEDRKQIEDIILETLKLDNRIIILQVCREIEKRYEKIINGIP